MRNLKKLLSLVLAVAMLASFCVVGASAADTYSETTKYPEAAAVVTSEEVGVIDGFEDGTMRYDAAVTREQAAAIICRILLGTETAAKLSTATAPFTDVAANRWSAGYIAYLKNHGVVSGVTDTTFNPTGTVTGLQFAKMLLSAAGYGVNGEYDGASWDINTITDANAHNIFADTQAADLTAGATREECMLYAFNAMTKMPVVKYNKTFESYYTGTNALNPVTGDVDPTKTTANDPYAYTMAYTNFKLKQTAGNAEDAFGRPSTNWTANGATVAENVASETPNAVLYGAVYSKDLYTALGKTIVKNLNAGTKNIELIVDGDSKTGALNATTGKYDVTWAEIKSGEFINQVAAAGATTELYVTYDNTTGNYSLKIVVYYEHIAKVTKATASAITFGGLTVKADDMDIKGIAKNDYVIYTAGKDGTKTVVATVAKADYVTGTYNASSMFGYTFDGKLYPAAFGTTATVAAVLGANYDNTYKLYTDSQGNLLLVELYDGDAAANNYQYVYVVNSESQAYTGSALSGKEAKVAMTVVYPNGGKDVLYYAVKYAAKYAAINGGYYITLNGKDIHVDGKENIVPAGWYSYTKNDAGNVTLKAVNTTYANTVGTITVATGKATTGIAGYTANSKTVLNIVDMKGNVATYTGIANFPTATGSTVLYTYAANSKVLTTITIYTGSTAVSTSTNYAYLKAFGDGSAAGTEVIFVLADGNVKKVKMDITGLAIGNVYDLTETDGEYSATLVAALTGNKGTVNAGYGMGVLGAGQYGYTDTVTFQSKFAEYATIDTVDANYFTTVAVSAEDAAESVVGKETAANTYYYDANTKIVDTTGNGATVLTSGNVFVAFVDKTASNTYTGEMYVSYVWIVG